MDVEAFMIMILALRDVFVECRIRASDDELVRSVDVYEID